MLNKELKQASIGSDSKIQGRPEDQMMLQWFKNSGLNQKLMQNFSMVARYRTKVPKSWYCTLVYMVYVGIQTMYISIQNNIGAHECT